MGHPAFVGAALLRGEGHVDQALEEPLVIEGHVSVLHALHGLPVLQEGDVDLRRVETADKAVEGVLLAKCCDFAGVHLHLGCLCGGKEGE